MSLSSFQLTGVGHSSRTRGSIVTGAYYYKLYSFLRSNVAPGRHSWLSPVYFCSKSRKSDFLMSKETIRSLLEGSDRKVD